MRSSACLWLSQKAEADRLRSLCSGIIGGPNARLLPVPMMNIINGGQHADNKLDIQEFMIMPVGADSIEDGVRWGAEIFHTLKGELKAAGHNTNVGDEGGFAPNLASTEDRHWLCDEGNRESRIQARSGCLSSLSMPPRPSSTRTASYNMEGEGKKLDAAGMVKFWESLVSRYPIISLEDGMAEDDWEGWKA